MEIKYTRRDKSTLVHLGHLEGIIVLFFHLRIIFKLSVDEDRQWMAALALDGHKNSKLA